MSKNVHSTKIEIFLKELNVSDVSKNYVSWLNDYEIVKYTEQNIDTPIWAPLHFFISNNT